MRTLDPDIFTMILCIAFMSSVPIGLIIGKIMVDKSDKELAESLGMTWDEFRKTMRHKK